ncbi:MAG TPA: hypothetical protein VGJ02_07860 [Pyrinomonadaceae bacterium]|jgi:hypothetical protein
MIAGSFIAIAFIELGSHAFIDSHDPAVIDVSAACRVQQNPTPIADCPERQRQRQESKNLLDEMTTHTVLLTKLSLPLRRSSYDTAIVTGPPMRPLWRELSPPFRPPEFS